MPDLAIFAGRLRRWPPLAVDVGIALACYAATVAWPVKEGVAAWWVYGCGAVASLPLVWRRRFPIPVAALVGAGTMTLALTDQVFEIPYGSLVATYTFASLSGPVGRALGVAGTATGVAVALLVPGKPVVSFAVIALPYTAAYVLGVGARARRDRIAMLEERGRRLAEERAAAEAERAAAEAERAAAAARERERIARDMHDILAHSISLIVVQAEAGPVVVRSDPARAVRAFDAIADAGRDALSQLRRTLGVLRADGPAREPQPDLDALQALVARAGRAGLAATLDELGDRRPTPAEVGLAAYRVVQESLTNTLKHAGATRVQVRLDWRDEAVLRLEVSDDGRGPSTGNGGHGLVGMRERVHACGGQLTTGAGTGGAGFRVTATLPLAGTTGDG